MFAENIDPTGSSCLLSKGDRMPDSSLKTDTHVHTEEVIARLDAVSELIAMERMVSEGGPVSEDELNQALASYVDQALAEEDTWL